jgi:hypothetical protein
VEREIVLLVRQPHAGFFHGVAVRDAVESDHGMEMECLAAGRRRKCAL